MESEMVPEHCHLFPVDRVCAAGGKPRTDNGTDELCVVLNADQNSAHSMASMSELGVNALTSTSAVTCEPISTAPDQKRRNAHRLSERQGLGPNGGREAVGHIVGATAVHALYAAAKIPNPRIQVYIL